MNINRLAFIFPYTHQPNTAVLMHQHSCFELVYYIQGTGSTIIDGQSYPYNDHTFALIRPHTYHNDTHDQLTELVCVGFSYDEPGSFTIENGLYHDYSCVMLQIVKKMKQEIMGQQLHYDRKLDLLMNEFMIEFERSRSASTSSDSFGYIENYMNEHFHQDIDLTTLAQIAGYSYHHFRHLFKQRTGHAPMNYIIHKRIEHARHLMLATDMTMSTISQECGFSNSSQFSSTFRKLTGATPSEFRSAALAGQHKQKG